MSDNAIMARFCKCGDLSGLRRKFHNLSREAKEKCLSLIQAGESPQKAIAQAKRTA